MYFLTRQFWLAAAVASALTLSSPLVAQTIEKGPVRTVLALGRVTSVIETPVYFKLSRVTIPAAATVVYRGDHSMIYLLSSALTVAEANDKRALQHGEGTYLRPSIELTLQSRGRCSSRVTAIPTPARSLFGNTGHECTCVRS